jgi:hypothetical protein
VSSPTEKTLAALKAKGCMCGMVERWIPRARIRKDLFGIIDIIALEPGRGIVGVQSTGTDFSSHNTKLTVENVIASIAWLEAGGHLELWSWSRVKQKRGGSRMIYRPRVKVYQLADFGLDPLDI